eukprot:14257644-Alexandrium_andersonii.AAC.1
MSASLVGSEMCIRDRSMGRALGRSPVLLGQAQAGLFAKNVYVRFATFVAAPRPGGTHFLGYC